jgi:hypothetical protein
MASRRPRKRRERARRTAAQWLARLTDGNAKGPPQLSADFVLWVLAGLLAHLDRRGDSDLADLAAGALVHGASLAVHEGAGWQRGGPAHQAALRTIAQAFADLDLSRGRRRDDAGAWELLNTVDAAYTGLCVGLKPDGSASDRDYLDEEMQRLGRRDLRDPGDRRQFRTTLRRRLLNLALEEVARAQLKARATERAIRARSRDMSRRLQRAGLLKLVGGSASFISPEGTEL